MVMADVWTAIWQSIWGGDVEGLSANDNEFYNILVEVYDDNAPQVLLDVLHARYDPTCLTELRANGAGSFSISKSDAKVLANPSLIDYRKYIKIRMNGIIVGGFVIQTKRTVIVGEGEEADEMWHISGEGPRSWARDAIVYPAKGLRSGSSDTRYFNFATERGSWYNSANWKTAVNEYKWMQDGNWWGTAPAEWPDAPNAYWVWDRSGPYQMPQGFCYFRHEFTVPDSGTETVSHSLFVAVDDAGEIYVDGELLFTTAEHAWQETNRIDFELAPGDHVIGIKAYNYRSDAPGALLAAFFKFGDPLVPTSAQLLSYTGQSSWKVYGYPSEEPGWSIGDVLLTLINEAKARGVRFAQNWKPTFSVDLDSAGISWGAPVPWSFTVGATYEEVIEAVEEMGCDIWVNPDTMEVNAWVKRGSDKSVVARPDANAIAFVPGFNLVAAEETGQAEIANTIALHASDGWVERGSSQAESVSKYGRVETSMTTQLSKDGSVPMVKEVFRLKSLPEKSATFEIVPVTGIIPFIDFNVGDMISAPGEVPGVLETRRVMSISFSEDAATGRPQFSLEFDTIFKDRQTELEKWVSRIANSGAIGGGFTNTSTLPPTAQQGLPGPALGSIPDAPTGLVVSSIGHYAPDGSSSSDYSLTWNPVSTGSGFGSVEITKYEVWGRKTSEPTSQQQAVVYDTFAYLQGYRPGDTWAFKVLAVSRTGGAGEFSNEVALTAAAPAVHVGPPSAPILTTSMGTVTVEWDGKIGGQPAPSYVRYVKVERTGAGSTGDWTEQRRNLFADPDATAIGSNFTGNAVTITARTDMPGVPVTNIRSTRTGTGAARLMDLRVGTSFLATHEYRMRVKVRSSHLLTNVDVSYRPDVTSAVGAVSAGLVTIPAGVSYVEVTAKNGATAPTTAAGISFVHNAGTTGATFDITEILIEQTPSGGIYFSGNTVTGDPNARYRWLGVANNSQSVYETLDKWVQVGTILNGQTTDASVLTGEGYDYRLVAVDAFGTQGDYSAKSTIVVAGIQSGDITGGLSSQNLVSNGSFEGGMAGWEIITSYGAGSGVNVVTGGISGSNYLQMIRGVEIDGSEVTLTVGQSSAAYIPVSAVGANGYFLSAKVAAETNYPEAFSLFALWYQGDKVTPASIASSFAVNLENVSTSANYLVGQVFPPADARFMRVMVLSGLPESTIYVDDIVAREIITESMIGKDAITAIHLSAGSVTANAILAESIDATKIKAKSIIADNIAGGAIDTRHISNTVGPNLDISVNGSVNILTTDIKNTNVALDGVAKDVTDMGNFYQFTQTEAIIGRDDSKFKLHLKPDRIEITKDTSTNVVSYWDSQVMFVKSFEGESAVLANHKIVTYGNGTIVKRV